MPERDKLNTKVYLLLVFLFFLSLYILPIGARNLIVPDEARYAEIPREMIASGDWIVPHFNGLRYFEKPVLGYWIHACSMMIFGENNFAVRLPSALSVGLCALLIYILIFLILKDRARERNQKSIISVIIFLSCFEVFAISNAAILDNIFSLFLSATIIFFYFATESSKKSRKEKYLLISSGIVCGLAFLTKGFLAFAIPVLTLVPYLVWQRRYSDLIRMAWLPVISAILVALPWSILIHLKEPDFWNYFFWHEHIHRFFDSNAQHKAPFWYFFVTLPGIFLIWIFLIPAAIIGIKEQINIQNKEAGLLKLAGCWFIFPFLLFSFSSGKLLTYVLPCFPPFAILMSFGLVYAAESKKQNIFFQKGIIANCIFFLIFLIIFVLIQIFGFNGTSLYTQVWKSIMMFSSLIFIIIFSCWSYKKQSRTEKIFLYGFSPFLLFLSLNFLVPDIAMEKKMPGILLLKYYKAIPEDTIIISDNQTAGSACWHFKRDNIYILGRAGELHYGLTYDDAKMRKINIQEAFSLIKNNPGKTILVGKSRKIELWQDQLPKPVFKDTSGPEGYVLLKY